MSKNVSRSPGWPQTPYEDKNGLRLLTPSAGIPTKSQMFGARKQMQDFVHAEQAYQLSDIPSPQDTGACPGLEHGTSYSALNKDSTPPSQDTLEL